MMNLYPKRLMSLLLALALLILPAAALATQVDVPEFGVTLRFPASLDVFTRNMPGDDPVLTLYGMTATEVADELKSAGLYADAYDIAGEYTITLALRDRGGDDFGTMDEAALLEAARNQGGGQYEVLEGGQGSFLLVHGANGRELTGLFQARGLWMKLRLQAGNGVDAGMVSLMKGLLARAEFSLGQ